jgi:SHS2 domain-containing protein
MSSEHKFIEHTADIAFDVTADSIEELFLESARAWRISVVGDIAGKSPSTVSIKLEASSLEELLVTFLNEINFLLLTENWLSVIYDNLKIDKEKFNLRVIISGFYLDKSVEIKEEIKSVTYHQMDIVKKDNKFSTRVVFDI